MCSPTAFEPVNAMACDVGVLDEPGADVLTEPGQELEHALRHPGGDECLDQFPGHQRRLLGGLEDDRVAGDECGRRHARRGWRAGSSTAR